MMGWNYEDCLQRLTERTFYGVSTLSGLPILKTFSGLPSSTAEELFRVDRVNEIQWNLRERMRVRLIERLFDWF